MSGDPRQFADFLREKVFVTAQLRHINTSLFYSSVVVAVMLLLMKLVTFASICCVSGLVIVGELPTISKVLASCTIKRMHKIPRRGDDLILTVGSH